MKPLEILQKLLIKAVYDGHKRSRYDKGKPGELVQNLPLSDRAYGCGIF